MNTSDIVAQVALNEKVPQALVAQIVKGALEQIEDALVQGDRVVLSGLGSFYTTEYTLGEAPATRVNFKKGKRLARRLRISP